MGSKNILLYANFVIIRYLLKLYVIIHMAFGEDLPSL